MIDLIGIEHEVAVHALADQPILELGPEQLRALDEYADDAQRVAFCTEPADRDEAERGVLALYSLTGAERPQLYWTESPSSTLSGTPVLPAGYVETMLTRRDSLAAYLDQVLHHALHPRTGAFISEGLLRYVRRYVQAVTGPLGGTLPEAAHPKFLGCQDAYWIWLYRYAAECLGVAYENEPFMREFREWERLARSCFWWWNYPGVAVICERPELVQFEELDVDHPQERLQHIRFRDGWSFAP